MNDDCLSCVLAYLCRHERRGVLLACRDWRRVCESCECDCVYPCDVGKSKTLSVVCIVHELKHGPLFLRRYKELKKIRHEHLSTVGEFVHFKDEKTRLQFVNFLSDTLKVTYCSGGTCCGGTGMKIQWIN